MKNLKNIFFWAHYSKGYRPRSVAARMPHLEGFLKIEFIKKAFNYIS
jgi:hypothetical protein